MGPETLHVSQLRFQGYKQALEANRIPLDMNLVKAVDFSSNITKKSILELMNLQSPPTAIFTYKNSITLDAIETLKKKYPKKLSTIEFTDFGNLPIFQYLDHKPVASIEEDFYAVGKQAALLLFRMIKEKYQEKPETFNNIELPCKLIIHK